jgi:glycosyltransferase involved in cell wall biosynthesis
MKMQYKYSICITNFNSITTIKESMESIFNQINSSFEIVVCDNFSKDGSREILQQYARKGKIKLVLKRSSRGRGRQIAFENSTGKYIISGVDTDDRLKPTFQEFLSLYHREHEGYMLSTGTIHIIPRQIIEEIGGWRDLTYFEDYDFHERAKSLGRQHELEYPLVLVERGYHKRSLYAKVSEIYNASICAFRSGISLRNQVKITPVFYKPITLVLAVSARVACKFRHVQKLRYPEA